MNRRGALPFTVTDHFISLVLLHSPLKCIIFRINTLHIRFVLPFEVCQLKTHLFTSTSVTEMHTVCHQMFCIGSRTNGTIGQAAFSRSLGVASHL